jgi:Holliday junction resolvase
VDGLNYNGWKVWRVNNQGVFNQKTGGYYFHGQPGLPDLIAIKGNKLLFVECKAPKKKMTEAQKEFLGLIDGVTSVIGVKACSYIDVLVKLKEFDK